MTLRCLAAITPYDDSRLSRAQATNKLDTNVAKKIIDIPMIDYPDLSEQLTGGCKGQA